MSPWIALLSMLHSSPADFRCDLRSYFPNHATNELSVFDSAIELKGVLGSVKVPGAHIAFQGLAVHEPRPYRAGENEMLDAAIEKLGLEGRVTSLELVRVAGQGESAGTLVRLLDLSGTPLDTLAFVAGAWALGSCGTHTLVLYGDPGFDRP